MGSICCNGVSSLLMSHRQIGHDNLSSHPNVVLVFYFILLMNDNLPDLQDLRIKRFQDCRQVVVEVSHLSVHIQVCLDFVHCVKLLKIMVMMAHYVVQNSPDYNSNRIDFETEIVIALACSQQCY